ncbi:MAG: menaquinone biosynthesis protein [Rikenellaceae bacterium]
MSQIKIAAVSYLNSIAFTYGIESSKLIDAELKLAPPVECTALLREREVDMALIPVAAIPSLGEEFEIVTSHCIGASAAVRTVMLMSDERPEDIKRIWLDTHSQSSVKLLAHLAQHHFKISPKWLLLKDMDRVEHPKDGDAFLLIGDKVFDHEGIFEYNFDLAEEWIEHTGLPFVFAAWCAHKDVDREIVADLEDALTWGVEHTFEALRELRPEVEIEEGYRYLTENIDTILDSDKYNAMERFWASDSRITIDTKE